MKQKVSALNGSVGRFQQIDEEKLCFYGEKLPSKTKKNTKWGLKIFQGK